MGTVESCGLTVEGQKAAECIVVRRSRMGVRGSLRVGVRRVRLKALAVNRQPSTVNRCSVPPATN